jgi:SHAQKYF class myb-like DNA-binding protein
MERPDGRSWNAHPSALFADSLEPLPSFYESQGVLESNHTHKVPRTTSFDDSKIASASVQESQPLPSTKKMNYYDDVQQNRSSSKKVKLSNASYAPVTMSGRWTDEEHAAFLRGLSLWGRVWTRYQSIIPTRSPAQVRSHAQKYFLAHNLSGEEEERSSRKAIRRHRHNAVSKSTPESRPTVSVQEGKDRSVTSLHKSIPPKSDFVQKRSFETTDHRRIPQRVPFPSTKDDVRPAAARFQAISRGKESMSQRAPPAYVRPSPHIKESFNASPKDPDARFGKTIPPAYSDMDELMALQALGLLRSQTSRSPILHCRSISE